MIAETKVCLSCRRGLHGRADKKFCNDYCRNAHHNIIQGSANNYMRNINHSLRKNRRILRNLLHPGRQVYKTSVQQLRNKGFSFHYHTHIQVSRKTGQHYFCYEYGYRLLKNEQVVITANKNRSKKERAVQ
jgi:hypothetical protein